MTEKEIIIAIIWAICIFVGSILWCYGAIVKPIKDTMKKFNKIDNEPVSDGIAIVEE